MIILSGPDQWLRAAACQGYELSRSITETPTSVSILAEGWQPSVKAAVELEWHDLSSTNLSAQAMPLRMNWIGEHATAVIAASAPGTVHLRAPAPADRVTWRISAQGASIAWPNLLPAMPADGPEALETPSEDPFSAANFETQLAAGQLDAVLSEIGYLKLQGLESDAVAAARDILQLLARRPLARSASIGAFVGMFCVE